MAAQGIVVPPGQDAVPAGRSTLTAERPAPQRIVLATDYPHQDGLPATLRMVRERMEPLSPKAKHQVLAGGAMWFCALR